MSEVKGTLLTIILAISVFAIVFAVITVAINRNSNSVAERMHDTVQSEPEIIIETSSLTYNFGE